MVYERSAKLLEAEVGSELVALNIEAGHCLGFNDVATSVWRLLRQPRSLEDLRSALLEEYEVGFEQCTTELEELLRDMAGLGLISAR